MELAALESLIKRGLIADLHYFAKIGSTNSYALSQAVDDTQKCPLLVAAREQTAGRGRGANRWWSSDGCLMFSLLLDCTDWLPTSKWPLLSLVTGISIAQTIEQLIPGDVVGVKWPNDVYLAGRKVAGILIETSAAASGRLVVGIGLNVNNSVATAPADIQARAVALVDRSSARWTLELVLERLVERLITNWQRLGEQGFESFYRDWPRYCILSGAIVTIRPQAQHSEATVIGRALGIDEAGCLVVETTGGPIHLAGGSVEQFSWPS
ncbi:biotin/acetyl-CoA-carboxylase ligase [Pirellula staleyi DSM 6068]|uniref:Biotin/acetyl-CoA-carboxylase ligase n=1 Tax=Pirellula staleyi (strain ATCC 27377 / DSM 6068 / ICPB 4128) TaxID=530564 RepID=D2R6U5_PIRSD|nr:biotin--[acetyl-CoA-carboxylase] ligase [Pirellula staleyi]ADB17395.1 biotin/acetyl-CoA-carboxylase ligase [Pirellula staleyi DSM 6068]